jgi:membrane protein DedA with SNARE-associated domain
LAGTNRMPWPKFILFNAAGGATWAATVGWAAYVLGTRIHDFTGPAGLVFLLVAAGLLVWLAMLVRKHEAQLQAQAEAAMPGPIAPV